MGDALEHVVASQLARAAELEDRVRRFVQPRADERALDVGTGTGALALALAPHVREVVGLEQDERRVERARELAAGVENVEFVVGDATALPYGLASFDLTGTIRTLHHVPRPELVMAEIARVTRFGGRVLVVDQLAPNDPLAALELDAFERAREPSHTRLLPDVDLRQLFEANRLVLVRSEHHFEQRALDRYLDLAGCEGEQRERVRGLAPGGPHSYTAEIGWYLLRR
jgi:ubiquinone/menaquinone biosynthesis C-methylase UbiE